MRVNGRLPPRAERAVSRAVYKLGELLGEHDDRTGAWHHPVETKGCYYERDDCCLVCSLRHAWYDSRSIVTSGADAERVEADVEWRCNGCGEPVPDAVRVPAWAYWVDGCRYDIDHKYPYDEPETSVCPYCGSAGRGAVVVSTSGSASRRGGDEQ